MESVTKPEKVDRRGGVRARIINMTPEQRSAEMRRVANVRHSRNANAAGKAKKPARKSTAGATTA